jgi:hypothetical protein
MEARAGEGEKGKGKKIDAFEQWTWRRIFEFVGQRGE